MPFGDKATVLWVFSDSVAPMELQGHRIIQQGLRFASPPAYDLSRLWRFSYIKRLIGRFNNCAICQTTGC